MNILVSMEEYFALQHLRTMEWEVVVLLQVQVHLAPLYLLLHLLLQSLPHPSGLGSTTHNDPANIKMRWHIDPLALSIYLERCIQINKFLSTKTWTLIKNASASHFYMGLVCVLDVRCQVFRKKYVYMVNILVIYTYVLPVLHHPKIHANKTGQETSWLGLSCLSTLLTKFRASY